MSTPSATVANDNGARIIVCDQTQTAALLDYDRLIDAIALAAVELEAGAILSPERTVVPLGAGGVLLSMPATAADIGIHKLVNQVMRNVNCRLFTVP
jgi:1-piperideine-2-carboxylate/1-pyrroline-2-carboxylate reductase [NAD(P)H]